MKRRPPFGELLRRHRLAAGLTHEQLAERAALSARGVSDLERGVSRRPRRETVELLGRALELSATERSAFEDAARTPAAAPTLGRVRGSVPGHFTSFVGRDEETRMAVELLHQHGTRLLTLTGPGGAGKSRLAAHVVDALAHEVRESVCYVELAPLAASADSRGLVQAIAWACGVAHPNGSAQLTDIIEAIHDTELLLILDNFEHLLPTAPVLLTLLRACPRLKLLVTSRASLHLSGEQELPVSPLAAPRVGQGLSKQRIAEYASVRLFVDRARRVRPDFSLTEDNARAVASICARLDGLPLALELAAARIKLLAPQILLERLDSSERGGALRLLTRGARDLPPHQRTLLDAMLWSYNLLMPDEQRLFRRLAIFTGGCTLAAAEALCSPILHAERHDEVASLDVLDGLGSLVDNSLVAIDDGPDGAQRFVLLETVREFGLEQLRANGELDAVAHDHARYYLELVKATGALLFASSSDQHRSAAEQHNIEEALRWLLHHG